MTPAPYPPTPWGSVQETPIPWCPIFFPEGSLPASWALPPDSWEPWEDLSTAPIRRSTPPRPFRAIVDGASNTNLLKQNFVNFYVETPGGSPAA